MTATANLRLGPRAAPQKVRRHKGPEKVTEGVILIHRQRQLRRDHPSAHGDLRAQVLRPERMLPEHHPDHLDGAPGTGEGTRPGAVAIYRRTNTRRDENLAALVEWTGDGVGGIIIAPAPRRRKA